MKGMEGRHPSSLQTTNIKNIMYKYRVMECPANEPEVAHAEVLSEEEAKSEAKRIVSETHNTCFIERFNGEKWQRGSVRYMWMFERVCFWNHR